MAQMKSDAGTAVAVERAAIRMELRTMHEDPKKLVVLDYAPNVRTGRRNNPFLRVHAIVLLVLVCFQLAVDENPRSHYRGYWQNAGIRELRQRIVDLNQLAAVGSVLVAVGIVFLRVKPRMWYWLTVVLHWGVTYEACRTWINSG